MDLKAIFNHIKYFQKAKLLTNPIFGNQISANPGAAIPKKRSFRKELEGLLFLYVAQGDKQQIRPN